MALDKHEWVSERVLFGGFIITGYFGLGYLSAIAPGISPEGRAAAHDVFLTVGPLIGIIVQSIWRTDKVDKINAETNAVRAAKAPDLSPIPAQVVAASPPIGSPENPVAVEIQPTESATPARTLSALERKLGAQP